MPWKTECWMRDLLIPNRRNRLPTWRRCTGGWQFAASGKSYTVHHRRPKIQQQTLSANQWAFAVRYRNGR